MKRHICFIIALSVINILPVSTLAFQDIKIKNHSFSVITEDQPPSNPEQSFKRTAVFIKNDDCNIQYKAMFGEIILGEGATKIELFPHIIQLGNNTLKIRCLVQKNISVEGVM
ncbi:MAG: hypothetical protein ABFS18_02445 [Thermodesulfobacteriota bacterium]